MRALRRILLTLAVLIGLYVAADLGSRELAQDQVAASLRTSLELSKEPDVSLGGFPFLPRAVDGQLDTVVLVAADVEAGAQPLKNVTLTLEDVRFSATDLLLGRETSVRFRSSHGAASMTGRDVTAAFRAAGIDATVRLADGVARVSVAGLPAVGVRVRLDGSDLVLRPADIPLPVDLRVDLSGLVPDIRYKDIRIEGSVLRLEFTLARNRFDF